MLRPHAWKLGVVPALIGAALLAPPGPARAEPWWPGSVAEIGREIDSLDRNRRLRAVLSLAAHEGAEAKGLLLEAMRDLDADVRGEAARILAARGDAPALARIEAWVTGGSAADRLVGLEALRLCPALSPAARTAVLRALGDNEVPIRLAALGALAGEATRAPAGLAPRVSLLLDDPAPAVRLSAVRLLGQIADRRAVLPLLARLDDPDRQVLRETVVTLGRLGDPRAGGALLRLLEEGPAELRLPVIEGAAALRLAQAVPILIRLARARPTDLVARRSQRALGEIGTPPAVTALVGLLDGSPPAPELAEALARHAAALEPELLAALEPGDVRAAAAARALGQARRGRARPALERLISRGDPATPAAIAALGALGDPAASETLVAAAGLPSAMLRRLALEAMLSVADPRTAVVLPARANDADAGVRALALRLAVRLRRDGAAEASGDVARSRGPEAAWILVRLGDPAPEVRRQAVAAVRALRPRGAVPALLAAARQLRGLEAEVGAALATLAAPGDLPALMALAQQGPAPAQLLALEGVATALAADRLAGRRATGTTLARLAAWLDADSARGELAAEALAAAGAPAALAAGPGLIAGIRRGWTTGGAAVRARLAPLVAGLPELAAELPPRLLDPRESSEVQAAVAWALAGATGAAGDEAVRAALTHARAAGHPAVAANAEAALAMSSRPRGAVSSVPVRLEQPGGAAHTGRLWLLISDGGAAVWARAGSLGQLRLPWPRPPGGSLRVRAAEPVELLEHPADRLRQIPRQKVTAADPLPRQARGLSVGEHADDRGVGGR